MIQFRRLRAKRHDYRVAHEWDSGAVGRCYGGHLGPDADGGAVDRADVQGVRHGSGRISDLKYTVSDPGGKTATGDAMLVVGLTTPPVVKATQLTVAANSGATPIGILTPTDASFAASALNVNVTGLPTDGKVVFSDGMTPVTVGESLTVAQLTGLEFEPTPGAFAKSSSFTYTVSDPSGSTTSGSATLGIGPQQCPAGDNSGRL